MKKNNLKVISFGILASFLAPFLAFAAGDAVTDTIQNIVNWLTMVGGGLAVLVIVVAGFMIIMANGDPGNVEKGKKMILYAAAGLIIILMARALTSIIENFVA